MVYAPGVVVEVVVAVSVAVSAVVPVMSNDVGERLHVAGLVAFVGAVTEHVRLTVPVNELAGVTEIVEVLPEVAPGLIGRLLGLLESEKLEPLGALQKPLHPVRNGMTARKSPAHLACHIVARLIPACLIPTRPIAARIPAPGGLVYGPCSPAP
jgi:hypothetical protein